MPSILLVMDHNLSFIHWNKNTEQLTGYTREEVKSMSVLDFIAEKDQAKIIESIKQLLEGRSIGIELHLETKSGSQIPYFWRGKTIQIKHKIHILCVGLNISHQLETEKDLLNEKRFNEAVVDSLPGIFYMLDTKGYFLKWNKNFEDEFGYSPEEMKQMHVQNLYEQDQYKIIQERIHDVFEKGDAATEAIIQTKEGMGIPYYLTGKLFERDGSQYLVGTGYNISEQKEAEKQLRQSELMFRNLFLKAPAAIVMVNENNEVIRVNRSFERLFGFTNGELKGKDLDGMIVPENQYDEAPKMPAVNFKDSHYYHQSKRKTKSGELKEVFVGSIPIYMDGEPLVGFGMYIDISEQKKYEEEISNSLQEKQVLLQEIHHRVKNNLAVISGLLQLQIYEIDDPQMRRMLQESQSRVKTMALIHEKLYQSQNLSKISCQSYIVELLETIQSTFKPVDKKVTTVTKIKEVYLNINQAVPFALMLNEVITNAYEHAFKGRREGIISIELLEEDGVINAELKDNGIGLPNSINLEDSQTLGLTLIINLLKQLDAEWKLKSNDGTILSLQFLKEDTKGSSSIMI